jgi:hypothetical protein
VKFKARVSIRIDGHIELQAPDVEAARKILEGMNPKMDRAVFEKHILSVRFDKDLERLRVESLEAAS